MRFTVTWHPAAEQELAEIWLKGSDGGNVAQAANLIDHVLASGPLTHGEDFYGDRIPVSLPLAVTYTVSEPDRSVRILQVWYK
jgi:plasmid stabilization system protein ParE